MENPRACAHCGSDITEQLDGSFEYGYVRGYEKHLQHDEVRLYVEKMLRDRDSQIKLAGADLMQILDAEADEELHQ